MASKTLRPGGPSGIENILREEFGVPAVPTIGRQAALELVRQLIQNQGMRCEWLALSDQPVARGALFDASGSRVPFPDGAAYERCYVALIDPEPATVRWAHPAHWAFIPVEEGGHLSLRETTLPEHEGGLVRLLPESPLP